MTELAFPPLLAVALLVEQTQHRLRVHTEGHLLHLHRLEKLRRFPLQRFRCLLLSLARRFFRVFFLLLGRFGGCGLCFELLNLLFGLSAFFL